MKKLLSLIFFLNLFLGLTQAQVIGSDTVCAGYIYNYSIVVPGAATYVWTVPSNWYELSGQGTSQINVTCNVNSGSVCVESFDSNSVSLGTQCLITNLGGSGGSYHLEPSGSNPVCDGISSVSVVPTLVYDGPGGGGCLPGCGNGTLHPNLVWGIYSGSIFKGLVGDSMSLGITSIYRAAYVDTTNGRNFPQAIEISGCSGSVTGFISFFNIGFGPGTNITPSNACVGDTVWIHGYSSLQCVSPGWTQLTNLIPLTSVFDPDSIQVIITGTWISYTHPVCFVLQQGIMEGTVCWSIYSEHFHTIPNCAVEAGFTIISSTICEDNCLSFTNSTTHATNYQWIFPGANPSLSSDTNPTGICYPDTGFFDVTLIASNPDSTDTLFLPGYIHVVSAPQSSFIPDTNSICSNDCILFSNLSVNASTYQWSFPGGNPSSSTDTFPGLVCYPNAGTYDVTLISSNPGCSDTLTISGAIHVDQSPQAAFSVSQINFCPGSCVDFYNQSLDGSAYLWNFNGASPDSSSDENPVMICYTDSGQYDVTLISTNGNCSDTLIFTQYITVYPTPPSVSIQQIGDTLFASTGFSSYEWYLNGNLISGATESFYVCTSNGDYNVIVTDSNGCEVEAAIYNVLTKLTSVLLVHQDFVVYPNPAKDLVNIVLPSSFSFAEKTTLKILNFQNRIVFSTSLISQSISVNQLSAGIYFIEIVGDKEVLRSSFLKVY